MTARTYPTGGPRLSSVAWIIGVAVVAALAMPIITLAHEGGSELTVSPAEIAAGDEISVSGEGFPPKQTIELHLTGPNGDAHLADATTDDDGAFTQQIVVPGTVVPGLYLIRAEGGREASAQLSVGAMPGMQEAATEPSRERERSPIWQAGAVVVLLALGGLGLALARTQGQKNSSAPEPALVRPPVPGGGGQG